MASMRPRFLTLFISLRCSHSCAHCIYGCGPSSGADMTMGVFRESIAIAESAGIWG